MQFLLKTVLLFAATAAAELVGCYLPYLWLRGGRPAWILVPAALSLGVFAWLLSLHPTASGRVYAAYGGVYVAMAVLWLWAVDGVRPGRWDLLGAAVSLLGMAIIMFAPRDTTTGSVRSLHPGSRASSAGSSLSAQLRKCDEVGVSGSGRKTTGEVEAPAAGDGGQASDS